MTIPVSAFAPDQSGLICGYLFDAQGQGQPLDLQQAGRWLHEEAPADGAFTPLAPAMLTLHRNLKQRFDPRGIFNRGRLVPDF